MFHILDVVRRLFFALLPNKVQEEIQYDSNSDDKEQDNYWYLMYSNPKKWKELYGQPEHKLEDELCLEPPPDWDGETHGMGEYEAKGGKYRLNSGYWESIDSDSRLG